MFPRWKLIVTGKWPSSKIQALRKSMNFYIWGIGALRIHWGLSIILKSCKKVYEVMIFDIQKYIYPIFYVQYILYYSGLFNTLWIEVKNKY